MNFHAFAIMFKTLNYYNYYIDYTYFINKYYISNWLIIIVVIIIIILLMLKNSIVLVADLTKKKKKKIYHKFIRISNQPK